MGWKHQLLHNVLHKRATLPRRPLRLHKVKDQQTSICLLMVKCSPSHLRCMSKVAMSASKNVLEASITVERVSKGGDVASSPSLLIASTRSGKCSLVHSPLHVMSCNECFQQQAGSINPHVYSCKRWRRCPIALCITNK